MSCVCPCKWPYCSLKQSLIQACGWTFLINNNLINFWLHSSVCNITHTHTHTHTHVGFYGLRGLFIGVMVFILYKLYVLLPYTYPTPKLSPHRRRCISTFPQKTYSVWFISILNYGDTENVLINHLLLVIPMLYLCHYTNLCPHKPHKHAHTHTHTHTHLMYTYLFLFIHKFIFCVINAITTLLKWSTFD